MEYCIKFVISLNILLLTVNLMTPSSFGYKPWNIQTNYEKLPVLSVPDIHSPAYLTQLATYEAFAFDALENLVESNALYRVPHKILDIVQRYQILYSDEIQRIWQLSNGSLSQNDVTLEIAQSPILAFNMLWRFVHELTLIHHLLQPYESDYDNLTNAFISDSSIVERWPNKYSIADGMLQIMRLQLVYDIDPEDLASGIILGTATGARLHIRQMLQLGQFAKKQKRFTQAIPWLELVIEILLKEPHQEEIHKIFLKDVESLLEATMLQHNQDRTDQTSHEYNFYTEMLQVPADYQKQIRTTIRKLSYFKFRKTNSNYQLYQDYYQWSLCSGNNHQTDSEKQKLTCWYDTTSNPGFIITPIKTELLSYKPRIIQIYNVLTDAELNDFIDLSKLYLKSSSVIKKVRPGDSPDPEVRSSVDVHHFKPIPRLNKFIESTTGLTLQPPFSSEPFRVASYAFGGHFECHFDAFTESKVTSFHGNRIATMMFYLEDTKMGGFTAFPAAGFAARPIKGSALFWYNLKRNGERDRGTLHCACPVIIGRKTIATQWIRHHPQFQRRPCGLQENE